MVVSVKLRMCLWKPGFHNENSLELTWVNQGKYFKSNSMWTISGRASNSQTPVIEPHALDLIQVCSCFLALINISFSDVMQYNLAECNEYLKKSIAFGLMPTFKTTIDYFPLNIFIFFVCLLKAFSFRDYTSILALMSSSGVCIAHGKEVKSIRNCNRRSWRTYK
jgi:hypothetical protein